MSERDYSKPVAERLRAFGVEHGRQEAERALIASLRDSETRGEVEAALGARMIRAPLSADRLSEVLARIAALAGPAKEP